MNLFDKYSLRSIPRAAEDGSGAAGGGAAGGGAAAGGAAAAGAAASGGNAAAGGAAAGGGAAEGGAAAGGAAAAGGQADQGWWRAADYGFDADTVKFFDGKNYPDAKVALSSLRSADEMARARNVLHKPDPKNPQGWDGFTELGWNVDRKQYTVNPPKLADGETHDEKAFAAFQDIAHEARLAPWQAEAVYGAMHKRDNEAVRDFKAAGAMANQELDNKLRSDWGTNYDGNVELAKRAFSFFKVDGITGAQMDQMMGAPQMVQLFQKIGAAMGEDNLVGDKGVSGSKSPAAARAERMRLENDQSWMKIFNDARHPQNKDYVQQRQALLDLEARK